MTKKILDQKMKFDEQVKFMNPETMPDPYGYSNVVEVKNGRMIYISGQVSLNKDGLVVGIGDLAMQTKTGFRKHQIRIGSIRTQF